MRAQKRVHHLYKVLTAIIILSIVLNMSMSASEALVTKRDVIIGFNKPVGPSEKALVQNNGGEIKKSFHLIPAMSAKMPETAIDNVKKDSRVRYIENDSIFQATDEYSNSWGVQHVGAEYVHNQSIYGNGVKIAVLDTGIDYTHSDLSSNYKGGYDFVFNDTDPFDDSYNSHGTHVSGILAAEKNGIGIVGVAPNASIYAVKVLDGAGFGNASWIISGIQWAVDNNMSIVTMSLGSSEYSQSVHDVVDSAYNAGLLLVASAGNTNGGSVTYPAGYDSVIAVTAIDQSDQKASFSPIDPKIELSAPGVNINSTIKGGYGNLSGTSMAAPYVTGVAVLIFVGNLSDVNGDGIANNTDVRIILDNSAKDLGDPGRDNIYGYGLVDASKAVLGISKLPGPPPPSPPPFIINLTLIRSKGPESKDAKNVSLSQGNYTINITNVNLSKIGMMVYENGVLRKDLSSSYKFNKSQEVNIDLNVNNTLDIVFVPYGKEKSIGYVTIRRL